MTGDFLPTASWANLRRRAAMLRQLRDFFDRLGFLEVETPILSADTVVDRHIDPLCVTLPPDPCSPHDGPTYWLQTSPEFGMKRLLAAGATAIYQVARVFRAGEAGQLHNPEFTLVEWYRVGDGYEEGMQLLSDLCDHLLGRGPARRIAFREAFRESLGLDPLACPAKQLSAAASAHGLVAPSGWDQDDPEPWLDWLLATQVAPRLGYGAPAIVYDFPAQQAALAKVRDDNPPVAERFELFLEGVEIANGYHELLDPSVLRVRQRESNRLRQSDGKIRLPEESRLLAAMEHGLPASSGTALGFDRLVMTAVGAKSVGDVIAFPVDRA